MEQPIIAQEGIIQKVDLELALRGSYSLWDRERSSQAKGKTGVRAER